MRRKAELIIDVMSVLDNIMQSNFRVPLSDFVSLEEFLDQGSRDEVDLLDSILFQLEEEEFFLSKISTVDEAFDYIKDNDPSLDETIDIARHNGVQLYELNTIALARIHNENKIRKTLLDQEDRIKRILKFLCNEICLAEVKDEIEKKFSKSTADMLPNLDIDIDTCEQYRLLPQEHKDIIKRIISEH